MKRIVRASTVSESLDSFCKDLLKELSENYEVIGVASDNGTGRLDTISKREGVTCYDVKMERRISPLSDIKSLWSLYRLFRKIKPDMVHSMTPKAGLLCMVASRMAGVPIRIHTFTGLVFPTSSGLKRQLLMFTDKLTCACATNVIPEGQGVLNDLRDNKITRKPMKVLGHGNVRGIDLKHYDPSLFKKEPNTCFTFIFIGRLVGDKGVNELVSAFYKVNEEFPDTKLLLVGGAEGNIDPIKPETSALIEQSDSIEAVGNQPDVRPWLMKADCAVLPSYREGFPNVVIEAGAMGLPQIVTDINGSREIIIDGKNGIIIPPRDVNALYDAMRKMIMNPESVKMMRKNARPLIAARYEQSFVRNCLYNFYDEVFSEY